MDQYLDHTAGLHRLPLADNLLLDLYLGDALHSLENLTGPASPVVDCWFMDGFSPARNPAMWEPGLIDLMAKHSRREASLSTYSVAGSVRRNLQRAGFEVWRQPGFGRKREMLAASFRGPQPAEKSPKLSSLKKAPDRTQADADRAADRHAVIVGAGLAGCSTAYSLACRGWRITLFEQGNEIAGGASGNPQAVLQPRLAANRGPQSRFYLQALLFASRQFDALQSHYDIQWHGDGVLRLVNESRQTLGKLTEASQNFYPEEVLATVTRQEASRLAGIELNDQALWLPYGGWLNPVALCQAYLAAIPRQQLQVFSGRTVTQLQHQRGGWRICATDLEADLAPLVILCNGYQACRYEATTYLPLVPVRGQLSRVVATPSSRALQRVVVGERYLCPADGDHHSIGASFVSGSTDCQTERAEDLENLAGIHRFFPDGDLTLETSEESRASVRCSARDYFPIVGAVPCYRTFVLNNAGLYRDAGATVAWPAGGPSGLYLNTAHGSYGLTSCPLAAELLASLVTGEYLPVNKAMLERLSPARFIVRDLKRQRIDPRQFLSD